MLKKLLAVLRFRPRQESTVTFESSAIYFTNYKYRPASLPQSFLMPAGDVREIDPDSAPPEARIVSGEILFVSATLKDQLLEFAKENKIPVVQRVDLWDLITEPFLDTEFSSAEQEKTIQKLEENGVTREECAVVRKEISHLMCAYNACFWEWVHLGLADVLCAVRKNYLTQLRGLSKKQYEQFYKESMELANRGQVRTRIASD